MPRLFLFLFFFSLIGKHHAYGTSFDFSSEHNLENSSQEAKACQKKESEIKESFTSLKGCECGGRANPRNEIGVFENCVKEACQSRCESNLHTQANACDSHIDSAFCTQACGERGDYSVAEPSTFNQQLQASASFQNCIEQNTQQVKDSTENNCLSQIKAIQNQKPGATLVCPMGGCESYCNSQSKNLFFQNPACGESELSTQTGLEQCQNEMLKQVSRLLPQDATNLLDGFSWLLGEKCTLDSSCEREISQNFQAVLSQCEELKTRAKTCCLEPLKCSNVDVQAMVGSLNSGKISMSGYCKQIKQAFGSASDMARRSSDQCLNKSATCGSQCGERLSDLNDFFRMKCSFDLHSESQYNNSTHTCEEALINKYVNFYKEKLMMTPSYCETLREEEVPKLTLSAQKIMETALSAGNCEKEASASNVLQAEVTRPSASKEGESSPDVAGTGSEESIYKGQASTSTFQNREASDELGGKAKDKKKNPNLQSDGVGSNARGLRRNKRSLAGTNQLAGKGNKRAGIGQNANGGGNASNNKKEALNWFSNLKKVLFDDKKNTTTKKEKAPKKEEIAQLKKGNAIKWQDLRNLKNANTALNKYGSAHDNIFKIVSDRITFLCQAGKMYDCER